MRLTNGHTIPINRTPKRVIYTHTNAARQLADCRTVVGCSRVRTTSLRCASMAETESDDQFDDS
jgi:hypothetical protein